MLVAVIVQFYCYYCSVLLPVPYTKIRTCLIAGSAGPGAGTFVQMAADARYSCVATNETGRQNRNKNDSSATKVVTSCCKNHAVTVGHIAGSRAFDNKDSTT